MSRRQKWVLGPIAALIALIAVVLLLFDWNWLKGPLESQISARLGRGFTIGALEVDLSLQPRITVTNLRLANPEWASDAPMLAVERATAMVDLAALFDRAIRLPEVVVTRPALRLETRPDGPPNWQFVDRPSAEPPAVPEIGQLRIANASIDYLDHDSGRTVPVRLAEVTGSIDGSTTLAAHGTLGEKSLALGLDGGPLGPLWAGGEPYALTVDLTLGQSDLGGELALDLGGAAAAIRATLHSERLRADDVRWLAAGAEPAIEEAAQTLAQRWDAIGRRLDFDLLLPDLELDLAYTIARLEGPELALQDVDLQIGLHDRLPTVAASGDGSYQGQPVELDVRAGPAENTGQATLPYQIEAEIEAGQTRLVATGAIDRPQRLQGVRVDFEATSPDLSELLRELGLPAPPLPELRANGKLAREGEGWQLSEAHVQFGESDLSGAISVDLSAARPMVSAKLESKRLRLADFRTGEEAGAADGDDAASEAAAAPAIPLIENGDVNLKALPAIDADLELRAGAVELPEFHFDRIDLDLQLRERVAVIDATGMGTFREQPLSVEVHAGTKDSLANPDAAYPVAIALQTRETSLRAEGNVDRPLSLTGLDVEAALEGPDLAQLGEILQLPLPATPPYDLTGRVTHQADKQRWNLVALNGTVGDSDLAGDVSFELAGERPTIVADLRSKQVDFDDLGLLVGAPPETAPGETASAEQQQEAAAAKASEHVLPNEPFEIPELRAIDARVRFRGDSVEANKLPLERMEVDFTLTDGMLEFAPLRFKLADGEFEATMSLDGRSDVLDGAFELTLRSIKLNQLLARFDIEIAEIDLEKEGVGTFGGHAKLQAKGKSVHELAASANGALAVIMDGGQLNALMVEAIGLDVGEALGLLITDQGETKTMVPLQCLVAQFGVKDGVMNTEALVVRTSDSTITGSGQIDLGEERLALELLAHPQDASALTATTPVRIEGTFKQPEIGLASEELTEKSLAAAALGVVLPVIGAILPFIETGEEDQGPSCGTLIRNAEQAAGRPDETRPAGAE